MSFEKLPGNSRRLLQSIVESDNPTDFLSKYFDEANDQEEARGMIKELREQGYINVMWADNKPWYVTLNNSARTYEERLKESEASVSEQNRIIIGDNNTISNSAIANNIENGYEKRGIAPKHPWICGIICSLVAGVILMFSFWEKIAEFVGGLL